MSVKALNQLTALFLTNFVKLFPSNFGLRLTANIVAVCGCAAILFLLSIPAPLVDFDAPELHPLGDGFDASIGPVGIPLELNLEQMALDHGHAVTSVCLLLLGSGLLNHYLLGAILS